MESRHHRAIIFYLVNVDVNGGIDLSGTNPNGWARPLHMCVHFFSLGEKKGMNVVNSV